MSATGKYILKSGIMDYGAGNRLNCIMNNTISLDPSMFCDSGSLVELSYFTYVDVYNTTNCSGTKVSTTRIDITPASSSTFSFCLTNGTGDPLINGFALVALPATDISISLVKTTLSETVNNVSGLCSSSHVNQISPNRPNGYAPYQLGDFRGYCHGAAGGVNIFAPNGGIITYGSTYYYYACATKNQINYALVKLEIYEGSTLMAYSTKSLTNNQYIECSTSAMTNTVYSDTTVSVSAIASYSSDSGATWIGISSDSNALTLKGVPVSADIQYVTVNSLATKLNYTYYAHNNGSSFLPFRIRIMNVTNSTTWVSSTDISVPASTNQVISGLLSFFATNVIGNTFDVNYSTDYGSTWHSLNANGLPIIIWLK